MTGAHTSGESARHVTASSQKRRIDWVDYAKGFCIIMVVMMHSTLGVEKAAGDTGWLHHAVQFAKPFRMPDFFLISGLFLALVIDRPWRRYLDLKVVHYLYFYVLWLTIQFAFKAPGWIAEGASATDVLARYAFSFIEPFGTLWFIAMLPVFFLVTRLARPIPWPLLVGFAALLEVLPIHTGYLMIDEFAERYVFFLCGYLFATRIFDLAAWAQAHAGKALAGIAIWTLANGALMFTPSGVAGSNGELLMLGDLPVVSLLLGLAGIFAIVCGCALIANWRWTGFLRWLGENSIVVYLAFFLPMAVSRAILLKFAPFLDIGTVSALVTLCGVAGPAFLYGLIKATGWGWFLFRRPQWARIEHPRPATGASMKAAPAE